MAIDLTGTYPNHLVRVYWESKENYPRVWAADDGDSRVANFYQHVMLCAYGRMNNLEPAAFPKNRSDYPAGWVEFRGVYCKEYNEGSLLQISEHKMHGNE